MTQVNSLLNTKKHKAYRQGKKNRLSVLAQAKH